MITNERQARDAAASPGARETEHRVKGQSGLILRTTSKGRATWWFYYRRRIGERWVLRKVQIGDRELTTLAEARTRAEQLGREVRDGKDPVLETKVLRSSITLRELFDLRCEREGKRAASTLTNYRLTLENDVFPVLGDYPAAEITQTMFANVLADVEARSPHIAHRACSALSSTYRWGSAPTRRHVPSNPLAGLSYAPDYIPRDRKLSEAELRKLWHGIEGSEGLSEPMRLILKLAILTGQRRATVAAALVSELHLEGVYPMWIIAGTRKVKGEKVEGRMKNKKAQHVPLVPDAVTLFRRALELAGKGATYAFPADMSKVRVGKKPRTGHINQESVSKAVRRLTADIGLEDATLHDMRRTITNWLGRTGTPRDVCAAILHHGPRELVEGTYGWETAIEPIRLALSRWATHVSEIVRAAADDAGHTKVVKLRA